jgi:hypothetical protein
MRRSVTPLRAGELDFPPTSGTFTGVSGMLLALGGLVWVVLDVHTLGGLRLALGFALFGLFAYAFMVRPRIRVRSGVLFLVNPLEDVQIPLPLVDRVTVRSATHVFVGQKRYVGVAVGRKVREMVRPRGEGAANIPSSPFSLGLGRAGGNQASAVGDKVPDLLEEYVGTLVTEARRGPVDATLVVRRLPVWWVVGPAIGLAVALLVTLVLG